MSLSNHEYYMICRSAGRGRMIMIQADSERLPVARQRRGPGARGPQCQPGARSGWNRPTVLEPCCDCGPHWHPAALLRQIPGPDRDGPRPSDTHSETDETMGQALGLARRAGNGCSSGTQPLTGSGCRIIHIE